MIRRLLIKIKSDHFMACCRRRLRWLHKLMWEPHFNSSLTSFDDGDTYLYQTGRPNLINNKII